MTTVERMQVEFSTNLEELIGSLYTVESRLSTVNDAFSRSEAAAEEYAANMGTIGIAAASSSEGFATLAAGVDLFSGAAASGTEAITAYTDSLIGTQGAVISTNYEMEKTVSELGEVNTAATNTATAIGRINNISNNAYLTFNRLSTNSTTAMKAIQKLTTETRTLSRTYSTATTDTDAFAKAITHVGSATDTVITQINEYSAAISTAGDEAKDAATRMDAVTRKTGETEGAMGKLSGVAGKVFAGLSVGTLLDTLDTIIERGEQVSQMYQNYEADISTSLGEILPELSDNLNGIVVDLMGTVPAAQNNALAKGLASLYKYQPEWDSSAYQAMMLEYASYADLWNMNLTDLISATQRLFTKYNIKDPEEMKEALGMLNAVNNLAPDAAPSSVISILNNNRQAIGASGWDFEEALSRVVNAGNDRAMSKFQEYLSALQNVKATKGKLFDSDEAFAAWIDTVTEMVRNARDETEAQNIIKEKYDIWGASSLEIAKYLRLPNSDADRVPEILAQLAKNGTGYSQYLRQETSEERISRANTVTANADQTVGDTMLDLKEQVALQNAYERKMYDVVSIKLGDLTTYIDKIPVAGEILSPLTDMVKDYVPEINIRKGLKGTAEEFIDKYEFMRDSGDYVPAFDENYYLAYRTLANELKVDTSDLQFSGTDMASVREDFYAGLYTDLIQRVRSARAGEEVVSLAAKSAEIIAESGVNLDTATFTGTLQLPDGSVLTGADAGAAVAATMPGTPIPGEEPKSWWEMLWPFGSDDDAETVEEEPIDYTNPLQEINASLTTMNTRLSAQKGDVYVTQYIYAPVADSYTVKNAAEQAVRVAEAGAYKR